VKNNKLFRTVALAVILSLLLLAITATPALAATATLSPTKGEVGEKIDVDGSGFTAGKTVYIYFSSQEADVGDDIDEVDAYEKVKTAYPGPAIPPEEAGKFDTSFYVPDELTDGDDDELVYGGDYYVYTTYYDSDSIRTVNDFTVIGIELDTDEGPVGTEVEIEGIAFDKNKVIKLFYDGATLAIASGDEDTDNHGDFTCTIIIPESTAGVHTITAEFGGEKGEAKFIVEPAITISLTSGIVGDEVTVNGTGFGDEVDITITFDGDEVAITGDDETDEDGSFEATFNVPDVGPGTYDVEVEDDAYSSAEAEFTITTDLTISPPTSQASPGYVGMDVIISGTGFIANHQITITYASTPVVFTTTSLADGSFSYTFEVPPSEAGEHTITATDGTNTMTVTFFMESTPPSTPQPLLPMMGDKAKSKAYFDWEDVTDDSLPVTYSLQIASDADFTTMVLEKTGLTDSEYTLTEEEMLESTSNEAPYYWKVRAIDAASNASPWTGAGTFYVGFVFPEIKGWILYTLMGVGGLLLFFLGLWIGRRTVPEYY